MTIPFTICNIFQSSPSIQRETSILSSISPASKISILSLYTEGDWVAHLKLQKQSISILSLYTEGDLINYSEDCISGNFNPLPLYRGRRITTTILPLSKVFQSSPSIQRETNKYNHYVINDIFQSSPSIQRETAKLHNILHLSCHIYVQLC